MLDLFLKIISFIASNTMLCDIINYISYCVIFIMYCNNMLLALISPQSSTNNLKTLDLNEYIWNLFKIHRYFKI